MRNTVLNQEGKVAYSHYYRAGGHVYVIPRGKGKEPAMACFEETPSGDGKLLWEKHDGFILLQARRMGF